MNNEPMTPRQWWIFGVSLLITVLVWALYVAPVRGATATTPNFVVDTRDPRLAREFADAAESHRRELAVMWLGKPMPDWSAPCRLTVRVGNGTGSGGGNGGSVVFVFHQGEVFGWKGTITGTKERIIDSTLPHEIAHMILASHFRRPVPRWADEGLAMSAEHPISMKPWRWGLTNSLTTGRGIPFNAMLAMTEYPPDFSTFYSQSWSLSVFLIQQGGRQKLVKYVSDGMASNQWATATKDHYGYDSVGELQNAWVAWVGKGSPVEAQVAICSYGNG